MGFGGSPRIPPPPPPPPSPVDPTIAERRRRERLKAKSGAALTTFTSPLGISARGPISAPSLMGGGGTPAKAGY